MRSKILLSAALAAMALVSCNSEKALNPNEDNSLQIFEQSFKVLEEHEMTADELFQQSADALSEYASEDMLADLKASFQKANSQIEPLNETKGIVPALYKTVRVEYMTPDQDGTPTKASALIVYPLCKKIDKVMLINHGTHIGFMLIPTQYTGVEGIMAATGALCIMPDFIGLGASKNHPDLYLNHEVHGTTSIDALLTLFDYAKAKRLPLTKDYKTYILGYSQGGSVSLASLRELQRRDKATQDRVRLEKVFCGDGPYDLRRTFETYVEDYNNGKKIGLGTVIPLVINSMFNSYPSEVEDMNYEDFFTPWALKTGVPQAIRANKEGIIDMILKFSGKTLADILNMDYIESRPDHLERLLGLMDRQNLCVGWQPEYKLKLLHSNPDEVVPFSNFLEATENLNNEYLETEILNINTKILSEPLLQHINGMVVMLGEVLLGEL